jgi:transcriptional regulator with XRE-family HTH domain
MNNLRELRLSKKIKASALADALSITPKHLYDLETGKRRLNIDHLQILTAELGVTADEILGEPIHVNNNSSVEDKIKKIMNDPQSKQYILVTEKAIKQGMSPETLEKLIDLYSK